MRSRTRRITGVTAAALAAFAAIPATPSGAAIRPCQAVVSQSTGSETAVVLEGHFRTDRENSEVRLTCHLVQNGVKVVSVTDPFTGPWALTVTDQRIDPDPYYVCYELSILVILGPQPADYPYSSDC